MGGLVRCWCALAGRINSVKRYRRLRRLRPDGELYRRRAAGESLRALARDYGVAHTTLGRHFARPQAATEVEEAGRLLRVSREAVVLAARAGARAERSRAEQEAAAAVAAGGGVQAVIEASGLRTLENALRLIDSAILARAFENDEARAAAPRLRRLRPDRALYRRRAAGERLRALAPDYGVAYTTLGRHFARPRVAEELERAGRLLRAERRAGEARLKAERKAEREARRLAKQRQAAAAEAAADRPSRAASAYTVTAVRRSDGSARFTVTGPPGSPLRIGYLRDGRASDPSLPPPDEHDARLPLSRADLHSANDQAAARAVAAGGGMQALIEATGLRTSENVRVLIDPATLERARQNDGTPPPTPEPSEPH